jgi:hypothetical protein
VYSRATRKGELLVQSYLHLADEKQPETAVNTRANIMVFIEHFLELAQKEGHVDYVRMMQRDIVRVVDAVAPDDGSGAANVKIVRKVNTSQKLPDFPDFAEVPTFFSLQGSPGTSTKRISRVSNSFSD